ncbi:MAG: cellulase family glycosylhydrolase [Hyphomonadaceae bacterium]
MIEKIALTRRGMLTVSGAAALCLAPGCNASEPGETSDFSPLWPTRSAPVLRGATIVQRIRDASIDGEGGASGHHYLIPHYKLADFEKLAATGANLVNLSVPGIWQTEPPYVRDERLVEVLMETLEACRSAGLYATIGFRTGPGRSEFIFHRGSADSWFPAELIIDDIWRSHDAQMAWGAMCVEAASLIAGRREIAGFTPMVEPEPEMANIDQAVWREMCWQMAPAIRAAAPELPLLISPPGLGNPTNLGVMGQPNVGGIVWNVHDYGPFDYTHQARDSRRVKLPGDDADEFASSLGKLKQVGGGLPLFMGEFGAVHWAPGREDYWRNRITALEAAGINWAAFRWPSSDRDYEPGDSDFTLGLHGLPPALEASWKQARLSRQTASAPDRLPGLRPRLSGAD